MSDDHIEIDCYVNVDDVIAARRGHPDEAARLNRVRNRTVGSLLAEGWTKVEPSRVSSQRPLPAEALFCRQEERGLCFDFFLIPPEEQAIEPATTATPSLDASDAAPAAVQQTLHRVSLASIKDKIAEVEYHHPAVCPTMTVAFVRMANGFVVIGESAPADPANFDAQLGREFAFENAVRKLWPLEGYALRDRLIREEA